VKILSRHVLRDHVAIGGILALISIPLWGVKSSFVFWLANVLIDLDHYLRFIYLTKFKVLGINAMFRFYEELFSQRYHPDFLTLEFFHTLEFITSIGIFGFFFPMLFGPVFWGLSFHIGVDLVHLARSKILNKRAHSFAEYFCRRKKIILRGGDPNLVFANAMARVGIPHII